MIGNPHIFRKKCVSEVLSWINQISVICRQVVHTGTMPLVTRTSSDQNCTDFFLCSDWNLPKESFHELVKIKFLSHAMSSRPSTDMMQAGKIWLVVSSRTRVKSIISDGHHLKWKWLHARVGGLMFDSGGGWQWTDAGVRESYQC